MTSTYEVQTLDEFRHHVEGAPVTTDGQLDFYGDSSEHIPAPSSIPPSSRLSAGITFVTTGTLIASFAAGQWRSCTLVAGEEEPTAATLSISEHYAAAEALMREAHESGVFSPLALAHLKAAELLLTWDDKIRQ